MRLGRIPWINCYPVYGAIDRGLVSVPAELVSGTASELNDLLAAGELQVSVVSAVEYARNAAAYHLLPDLAITCDGPVHSVALFSKRPVEELDGRTVLVTASSRTSVLLLDLLCRHRWGVHPRFATARAEAPDLDSLAGLPHEAVLVIGDAALMLAAQRRYPGAARPGRRVACVDRTALRVRGLGGPARGRTRRRCRPSIGGCSSLARGDWPISTSLLPRPPAPPAWPEPVCRDYLGDLDYALSYRHLAGLTDFFGRLAQDGLVPDGSLSFSICRCLTAKSCNHERCRPHFK